MNLNQALDPFQLVKKIPIFMKLKLKFLQPKVCASFLFSHTLVIKHQEWKSDNLNQFIECLSSLVGIPSPYFGDPRFKSCSEDQMYWLSLFIVFVSPSKQMTR